MWTLLMVQVNKCSLTFASPSELSFDSFFPNPNSLNTNFALISTAQDFPALPLSFFCRPAEVVGLELVGCRLVKRQKDGCLLWGVIA